MAGRGFGGGRRGGRGRGRGQRPWARELPFEPFPVARNALLFFQILLTKFDYLVQFSLEANLIWLRDLIGNWGFGSCEDFHGRSKEVFSVCKLVSESAELLRDLSLLLRRFKPTPWEYVFSLFNSIFFFFVCKFATRIELLTAMIIWDTKVPKDSKFWVFKVQKNPLRSESGLDLGENCMTM